MTLVLESDLDTALADWGQPVSTDDMLASAGVLGLLRSSLQLIAAGVDIAIERGSHVLMIKPGTLGEPCIDEGLTIGGVEYVFRGAVERYDGPWERHYVVPRVQV